MTTATATTPEIRHQVDAPAIRSLFTPWRLLAIAAGVSVLVRAVHPIIDIDLYWHIPLGQQILDTHHVHGAGGSFAYTLPGSHWVTTQWASEVGLALLYKAGGFAAIGVLRMVFVVLVALAMARQLLTGRHTAWASVVFAADLFVASSYFQERPQLVSLLLLVWLAGLVRAELAEAGRIRWWIVPIVTCLWANFHGLWLMVPVCYALLAVGALLERLRGRADASPRRPLVIALTSAAAACVTPVGPKLLLSPLAFAKATKRIDEWQPTNFHNNITIVLGLSVALIVVAWARARNDVPIRELVYVGGLTAFALGTLRDVPPAMMLLAPVILDRVAATFPFPDRITSRREAKLLTAIGSALLVLAGLATVARFVQTPSVPASEPRALAQRIAATPGEHFVLDDYNTSGAVILWGGPRTKVAVDGRADRYGAAFLDHYYDLMQTQNSWRTSLRDVHPDFALLDHTVPLVRELGRMGWTTVGHEDKWVLLAKPGVPVGSGSS